MNKVIILNSTCNYQHAGCSLTMAGLRRLLLLSGATIIFEWDHGRSFQNSLSNFLINNKDTQIVINGEGTFHDDQSYMKDILNFCQPFLDRTSLLNTQFNNIQNKYIDIIRDMKLVQIRNKTDWKTSKIQGIDSIYCPDMLFFSGLSPVLSRAGEYAIFTDSQDAKFTKELWTDYKNFSSKKKWINFHYNEIDSNVFKKYAKKFNTLVTKITPYLHYKLQHRLNKMYLSELIWSLASAKSIHSGRYHAICMAILLQKDFNAYSSNTPKVLNLVKDYTGATQLDGSGPLSIEFNEMKHHSFLKESNESFVELINALNT